MLTMKSRWFALAALMAAAPAYAKDASANSAILDRGFLTQASADGVLRLDVASAVFEIQYADGHVYRDVIPPNRRGATDALIRTPFWVLGGAMTAEKAICTEEARLAADLLDMVTRACSGGQSAFCTDARETLGSALTEFNGCLSHAFPGGGSSSGGQGGKNGGQNGNPPGGGGQPPSGENPGQPEN